MGARTYKDLDVWKIADELRTAIRLMVRRPSFDRHEWLRLQLRRAANSGCTNTAEGFGRYLPRDFARFLRIARGSLNEIAEHMPDVREQALAPSEEIDKVCALSDRGARCASGLIDYLERLPEAPRRRPSESPTDNARRAKRKPRKQPPRPDEEPERGT